YDSQNYGGQGYGSQPGYDQQAGGYPTHYQNGYQQQPYGGQDYGSQGYGAQGYGGYNNYPGQVQGPVPGKGLAIASLVLGIVGILSFWFLGLGGLLGLVGLVLGIIGLVKIRRSKRDSPALAIVGIVLSSLALLGGILMAALFAWVFSTSDDCLQYVEQGNQTQYQQCVEGSLNGTLDS
ncbi:DUF4190 domain-containing protein, partial [Kocuria sp.]|uniref:DUF4190 domain-containing protein n=1 Tax=Kocuria sp. TaxID=1871328 RepID=UPI0026DB73A9